MFVKDVLAGNRLQLDHPFHALQADGALVVPGSLAALLTLAPSTITYDVEPGAPLHQVGVLTTKQREVEAADAGSGENAGDARSDRVRGGAGARSALAGSSVVGSAVVFQGGGEVEDLDERVVDDVGHEVGQDVAYGDEEVATEARETGVRQVVGGRRAGVGVRRARGRGRIPSATGNVTVVQNELNDEARTVGRRTGRGTGRSIARVAGDASVGGTAGV